MNDKPVIFNELELKILEMYVSGKNKDTIANELELPIQEVQKVFKRPKVKEKIQELIEMRELMLKEKHLNLLENITEEMFRKAMESGDFSSILNKGRDILDVIAVTNQVTKEIEKKRLGTGQQNVMINILNQLSEED